MKARRAAPGFFFPLNPPFMRACFNALYEADNDRRI
jgi:hypothetical protein